jgi:hypothetical protein
MICLLLLLRLPRVTGPVVADAMFVNREEIPVYPCTEILGVYILVDSILICSIAFPPLFSKQVHNFGFFAMIQVPLSFLSMMRFRWHVKQHQLGYLGCWK